MTIRVPKLTSEHFFEIFLALFWGQEIVCSYARAILVRIPYIHYVADYIIPLLMLISLCLAFPYFSKSISWMDIIFTFGTAFVYFLDMLLFPENESLASNVWTFFFTIFPIYFIGLRFDSTKHLRILYFMSIVNIWAFSIYYILIGSNPFSGYQGEYNSYMGRAYVLLPQLLVIISGIISKKNIINIATAVVGFVLLLMCGNRGSVLLLLIYITVYFLFNFNLKSKKAKYIYVGTISVLGIIVYFHKILITMFSAFFVKLGWSVRVFERLLAGTFFESDSRNKIIEQLHTAIWEKPIIGYGLCSDRTITGTYAHNYAFELWTAFGVIFGTIILIATIYVIFGAWIKSKDREFKGFLLLLICVGFIKLFISSSFINESLFFMLLGVCVTQHRRHKTETFELGGCQNEDL